ncbi:hypothetical protein [Vibrio vulnificus]|uniref:hypothetical protein n=1 Tax=Vibrio vulnificus TaxID=672 RepID=UPI0019D44D22|nr:hypothetical protein [Vibrio vulnificus]MBN8094390.1 hypothetical protein [Vibrio vulnificus]MBY7902766.1 hypothetical protein [Vibrio fluvialis]MBY7941647.1 hypothetical protein [Vibrio fluvialis]
MSQQLLQIPRQSDASVIECFKDVAKEFGVNQFSISVVGYPNLGQINLSEENEDLIAIAKAESALIDSVSINVSGLPVSYHRGGTVNFNSQQKQKSPYFDELVFTQNSNIQIGGQDRIKLTAMFASRLSAYTPERGVGETPEQVQLSAIHNATLERLERLNEELVNSTHDYRKKLDNEFSEKSDDLEKSFEQRKKALEEKYSEAHKALEEEKKSLEARRKELDDKDNTHARREIRKDILREIKNRQQEFKLTQGTVALRKPISIAMIVLVSVFLFGAGTTGYELFSKSPSGNDLIFTLVKQVLYTFGAVGSLIFYIRWMNRWFEQHSLTEFHLKQFELDMERASWLVETSLEWKDAKGTAMPPELMQSLSTNLFSDRDDVEHIVHPADQLASALLGSASSIKLRAGDSSIEVDPKKLNKMSGATAASNK